MFIGTAGWTIPAPYKKVFRGEGSHLERYGAVLKAAEINSSFYRSHQQKTWRRWAESVPAGFRFSVKAPRAITRDRRLEDCDDLLTQFLDEIAGLGRKLGVILVQLPPNLDYDAKVARKFFRMLGRRTQASIACEPRHASWFAPAADADLAALKVARVAADPPRGAGDGTPGGWKGFAYWRLHGSPRIYYSGYSRPVLKALAPKLRRRDWCMFDNTMSGAALGDALTLKSLVARA